MRGRFLDRRSRKQFRHPLPPATSVAAQPLIPRHTLARVTPPPPALLKGRTRHGPVRGLGQTSRQVVPGSRRIHQPAPCPQLYRGGARRGWLNQSVQQIVLHEHRWSAHPENFHGPPPVMVRSPVPRGKKGNKPPPKPPPLTAAPIIIGSRVVRSPAPRAALHGRARHSRLPGQVTPFLLLASRRVQNPQARPRPEKGRWQRRRAPNMPPLIGLEAVPVVAPHRFVHSQAPWPAIRPAVWRGRLPEPTAPFLLREGRRYRGSRPQPYTGQVRRGLVPRLLQVALARIPRHRRARSHGLPADLLQGRVLQGPLFNTGLSAQTLLLPCDVVPLRVDLEDLPCALRPEISNEPGQRVQEEDSCPARPPRCPDET